MKRHFVLILIILANKHILVNVHPTDYEGPIFNSDSFDDFWNVIMQRPLKSQTRHKVISSTENPAPANAPTLRADPVLHVPKEPVIDHAILEDDLFNSLTKKEHPIYLCPQSEHEGSFYLPPVPPECPFLNTTKPSKAVTIQVFYPNPTSHQLDAYLCFKIRFFKSHTVYFFGSEVRDKWETQSPISAAECKSIVHSGKAPDGTLLRQLGKHQYGTNRSKNPVAGWSSTKVSDETDYFYTKLKISVSNHDQKIISYVPLEEECHVKAGECSSKDAILIWDPTDFTDKCRLVKSFQASCLLTDDRLTCMEAKISITGITTVTYCGLNFGFGKTGILFSQSKSDEISPDIVPTSVVEHVIKDGKLSGTRNRRESDIDKLLLSVELASIQKAELQFIYDVITEKSEFEIQSIHRQICMSVSDHIQMLVLLAEVGYGGIITRALTGDMRYQAKISGDALVVQICDPIFNYRFIDQQEDDTCYKEASIEFLLGHKIHKGYLEGFSHRIVFQPTATRCPTTKFVFRYGSNTVIVANRSVVAHIPTLPSPYNASRRFNFPKLTWSGPGSLSINSINGEETLRNVISQANRLSELTMILDNIATGEKLTHKQQDLLDAVTHAIFWPFKNIWEAVLRIGGGIIGISIAALLLYLAVKVIILKCI